MFFRRKFQPIIFFLVFLFVGPFPSYAQQTLSGMVVADSELATKVRDAAKAKVPDKK